MGGAEVGGIGGPPPKYDTSLRCDTQVDLLKFMAVGLTLLTAPHGCGAGLITQACDTCAAHALSQIFFGEGCSLWMKT